MNRSRIPRSALEACLIVCAGQRFDARCDHAVRGFLARPVGADRHLVMSAWLDEDEFARAEVLWVVDRDCPPEEITRALKVGLPLLVPAENTELRTLCHTACCGLYYNDAVEAVLCLEYLIREKGIRHRMAANAHSYFRSCTSPGIFGVKARLANDPRG